MTKHEQSAINTECMKNFNQALEEMETEKPAGSRLRTCTARVYTTTNYYLLQSYNTFIACIKRDTNTLYDVLRVVYGYTNTSGQHIAKFRACTCYGGFGGDGITRQLIAR